MRVASVVVCLALILSGCYERRYGIAPVLNPAAVQASTNNQTIILTALAQDANIGATTAATWYQVAEAGFNYIDDECRLYFNELFFLNRDKERNKSLLINGAATTAAILYATGASKVSMEIVAQAFGFGGIANELVAGTYLYQLPPATTLGFVKEMQLAYREGLANRRALITNAPATYHAIQQYLSLCLPPTIEAKMAEHIGAARAVPDSTRGSSSSSFGITLTAPVPATRQEIRAAVGADNVAAPPLRRGSEGPRPTGRIAHVEPGTGPGDVPQPVDDWAAYRKTLCVTDENTLGPRTRQALKMFKAAINAKLAAEVTESFSKRELDFIVDAQRKFPAPACSSAGSAPHNAFEVGLYTISSTDEVNSVLRKALTLARKTKPDIYSPGSAETFDTDKAVMELRAVYGLDVTAELDDVFWNRARKRK